jgi:carboxylesterase
LTEVQLSLENLFTEPEHRPYISEGGRPAALLVHGFVGTPAEMRAIGEALLGSGWTVQALLLPGFGSDLASLPDRRNDEWLDCIGEAVRGLRQAGKGPLLVVGYSLGATLSIIAGGALQPQPDGLVLLAPFWWQDRLLLRLFAPVIRPFLKGGIQPFRRADLRDQRVQQSLAKFLPGADLNHPDVQRALRDFRVPLSLVEQVIGVSRLAYERAGAVASPVLVVQGQRDEVVRTPLTRKLLRRFSGPVEYLEVDSGHELTRPSDPAWPAVSDAILRFADGLRRGQLLHDGETGFISDSPAYRKPGMMAVARLRE